MDSGTARNQPGRTAARARTTAVVAAGAAAIALTFFTALPIAQSPRHKPHEPPITPAETGCSQKERREALRAMQNEVLKAVPARLESFANAIEPGGPLAGWNLSHGYVVLASAGAVAVANLNVTPPLPQLLLYQPSPTSTPADWFDFDGPDDPYRLVGWGYLAPYTPGSRPPCSRCIAPGEWLVHEAGWHLKDGGMELTPGAATEPPRPPDLDIYMWHPQVWDLHVWRGRDGVPTVSFANPHEHKGGKELPADAFFYPVNGRKVLPSDLDR